MITVASFDNQANAYIAKGLLEAEGLSPQLADEQLVQTDWLYSAAIGGIKLQVPPGEASRAQQLLDQDRSRELMDQEQEVAHSQASASVSRAALVHIAALSGVLLPLGHLLGPLVVWLGYRGREPLIDAHGREAINFQGSITLYAGLVALLLESAQWPALLVLFTLDLLLILRAGIRARQGQLYRYPFAIPWLSRAAPPG